MGSTPSQTFEADLNGTGTLVSVTNYVRLESVEHEWGRTDWAASEPRPGVLRFVLENIDGRFTPGNTSVYAVGCVQGCRVVWTCGGRARTFRMSAPEVSFPTGVQGLSLVSVTAYDALQDMSRQQLRSMFDDTVMARGAYHFWPLSEPASVGVAADIAGVARKVDSNLYMNAPFPPAFGWGDGVGPDADGRAALVMWPGIGAPPPWNGAWLTTGAQYVDTSSDQPDEFRNRLPAGSGATLHANTGSLGLSMWVNPSDTAGYPAYVSATNTDYDHVILANLGWHGIVAWRPKAHRLSLIYKPDSALPTTSFYSLGAVPRGVTTHIALTHHWGGAAVPHQWYYKLWVNGVAVHEFWQFTSQVWEPFGPQLMTFGGAQSVYTGIPGTLYGFAGTLANISIHRSPGVYRSTVKSDWSPQVVDIATAGTTGLIEKADARFVRLGRLLGREDVSFQPQGTPQDFLLGDQDTAGDSILAAVCVGLRAEGACLDSITTAGVDEVRGWMGSTILPPAPAVTIDVDADAQGVPELSYDTTGVAQTVTVSNRGVELEVLWKDADIPARWAGTSADEDCALMSTADALLLAQHRSMLGRSAGVAPSRVVVDAVTSKANLTASLVGLRPGLRIRLTGFPSSVIGYASIDCMLIGARERYRNGRALFELRLVPVTTPEGQVDPEIGTEGPWRVDAINETTERWYFLTGWTGTAPTAAYTTGATTLTVYHIDLSGYGPIGLSTDSYDYPIDLKIETGEVVRITAAPPAPVSLGGGNYYQVVTVARAQQGTTAVANATSPGAVITRMQNLDAGGVPVVNTCAVY